MRLNIDCFATDSSSHELSADTSSPNEICGGRSLGLEIGGAERGERAELCPR
jgi:hypothetical protein